MAKKFTAKVITTNRLLEGDAVYLTRDGIWSPEFGDAELFTDPAGANLALETANRQTLLHVGAYFADAETDPSGRPSPTHYRERLRSMGPSNYCHGKQAERANV